VYKETKKVLQIILLIQFFLVEILGHSVQSEHGSSLDSFDRKSFEHTSSFVGSSRSVEKDIVDLTAHQTSASKIIVYCAKLL